MVDFVAGCLSGPGMSGFLVDDILLYVPPIFLLLKGQLDSNTDSATRENVLNTLAPFYFLPKAECNSQCLNQTALLERHVIYPILLTLVEK